MVFDSLCCCSYNCLLFVDCYVGADVSDFLALINEYSCNKVWIGHGSKSVPFSAGVALRNQYKFIKNVLILAAHRKGNAQCKSRLPKTDGVEGSMP